MNRPLLFSLAFTALMGFILIGAGSGGSVGFGVAQSVELQEVNQPLSNVTASPEDLIFMIASTTGAYATVPEHGQARYEVTVTDVSPEGARGIAAQIPVRCVLDNQTEVERGWSIGIPQVGRLDRNEERTITITISPGASPEPRIYRAEISCHAGSPLHREIGRFVLSAKVDVFERFTLTPAGPPPRVGPDELTTFKVNVVNRGNTDVTYVGKVDAPEGWVLQSVPPVVVPAGENLEVEIQGLSPREKIWYREAAPVVVSYWPSGSPEQTQQQFIPVTLHGLYLHPALISGILLGLLAVAMLFLLLVYARRTVEEQVLGKPVPPWRIPIEREYLVRLEKEDPDEFYIVRYHLMVEEHESALLWFKHFKHATRKDRKHERAWLKKKEKMEAKTGRLERRHGRMKAFVAWRLRRVPRRRRRRLARLDKKLHHDQWKEQRKLLKVHRKSVKRIDEIHSKRKKRLEKDHGAQFAKEEKRIAKENRKRVKRGEDSLPLPEEHELQIADPDFPQVVEVPILPVQESRFAVRAERMNARFNRKIARRTTRAQKKLGKKKARLEKKTERLKAKVPPEPVGELYRVDEFVPEEDVVVEDARPVYQRALRIPPMETRDALKRRRLVYKSKIAQAKNANDPERVERLKQEYAQERARLLGTPVPKQKREAVKKKKAVKPEKNVADEDAGGGPLRLKRRRGGKGVEGGKEGSGDGAVDAANQGSKDQASISEKDGSSRGERSTEE